MSIHRRAPRPLAATLEPLRESWAPDTLLAEIQRTWPNVVGGAIAAEATPHAEHDGTLSVRCSSAAWAQELELMGVALVARLNDHLRRGRVTRLRCSATR